MLCFFFYSLSLTITRILGEFIASGLKLIISARHPKYKRNYVMVFCPGPNRYNDLQRKIWGGDFMLVHLCGLRGIRMQGKLTVNTVAQWAWYWLHRGGMLTFYMVYGQMHRTSCALYYCNDRHSHHSLCLCNLYHLQVLPSTRHLFPPPRSETRSSKWGHPSCSCWPTCKVSQRSYMLARWPGSGSTNLRCV